MKQVRKIDIYGLGALGTMYAAIFTEKLGKENVRVLADGEPSMRQDSKAGRKTEVNLFAGTVCELGKSM